MSSTRGSRRAFTLVEMMVVVAVAGVLVGLLLPAVQAAREAARKTQCQSNLKQIGLAALNFESTYKQFPSGGWGFQWQGYADVRSVAGQPGSWTYSLLPYLEQTSLYHLGSYYASDAKRDTELQKRVRTPVSVFNCPSRRGGQPQRFAANCPSCAEPIGTTNRLTETVRCDYAANVGDGAPNINELDSWPLNYWGPADVRAARRLVRRGRWPQPPADWTGISWLGKGVRLAELTDGSSSTILFGEKYVMRNAQTSGADWGNNEPLYSGFNNDNHRSTHPFWPLLRDEPNRMSIGSFGSIHASGSFFALADGSVHHFSYSVDQTVYRHLGNRHDGTSTEVPQ